MPSHLPRLRPAAALLILLAAPAAVQVELTGPGRVLDPEEPYFLRPLVTGAGDRTACHWAVTEGHRPVGPAEGVRLEVHGERGAILSVAGGPRTRTLRVRATASEDLDAYGVAEVQVAPEPGAAPAGSAGETKTGPRERKSTEPAEGPEPYFWMTHFTREFDRDLQAIAWDPCTPGPAILALERDETCCRVAAITLEGEETPVDFRIPAGPALDPDCRSLAVMADGSILVADPEHRRIARIVRSGAGAVLETYAGTGAGDFNGDQDRLQANLGRPSSVVVTAAGEVLFADSGHGRIRRITAAGRVETLAGDGDPDGDPRDLRNDLDRRHPATATTLAEPRGLAAAPDGRILFHQGRGGWPGILALRPDRTLAPVAAELGAIQALGVTAGNEAYYITATRALRRVDAQGGSATLVPGCYGDDGPMDAPLARGTGAGLAGLASLVPAPGGGLLALDTRVALVLHLGPPRVDRLLAERVQAGLDAARNDDWQGVATVRAGLRRQADLAAADPDWRLGLWSKAKAPLGRPGAGTVLAPHLQRHLLGFLGDTAGIAFRARVALDVLGLLLDGQHGRVEADDLPEA